MGVLDFQRMVFNTRPSFTTLINKKGKHRGGKYARGKVCERGKVMRGKATVLQIIKSQMNADK